VEGTEAAPVVFAVAGAAAPTSAEEDWGEDGVASIVPSRRPGESDVRTGSPGTVGKLINAHPIFGKGHFLKEVRLSLQYIAGYGGGQKMGSNVSVRAAELWSGRDLGLLCQTEALSNFSFDHFTGYSPPVGCVSAPGLRVPNSLPLLLSLVIHNNDRNLQIPIPSVSLSLAWTSNVGPDPAPPVSNVTALPADASIVMRGPLLFALHPEENRKVVASYDADLPARPKAVDYEISTNDPWAFALALDAARPEAGLTFDATPSHGWSIARPFDTEAFPFSISARAVPIGSWGYWKGSNITAQPPPSPVNCSDSGAGCGSVQALRLVPFGGTNIRISVFPWTVVA